MRERALQAELTDHLGHDKNQVVANEAGNTRNWRIHVKVRDNGTVRVKALYLAIGVNLDGIKEVLGLWMAQTESAKFWLQVVT